MITNKELVIYYFSGTGNSRNVAGWISSVASRYDIDSTIINIAAIDRRSVAPLSHDALVVIVSPVHGFNYPPIMLNFLNHFPIGRNKVLLMNTRAGMLIGKFNVPGVSGIAFYYAALILKLKGYSIIGMVPVDLPSNWISIHPGLNERTINFLQLKNKKKVLECAEKILSGKKDFRVLHEIIQDIIASPVSLGYYLVGRFFFAKTFIVSSDCNNCDLCIRNCPNKAIIKINDRLFWTFRCESCMNCIGHCPKRAIETAHGFIIGFLFYSSALTALFFKYFENIFFLIDNKFIENILEMLLFLFWLGISYRIIHYLLRFKLVEKLMVYTSLTRYKFWGRRYKAPQDNE